MVTTPENKNLGGGKCQKGFYCSAGSTHQKRCPPGQFQEKEGMEFCDPCPAGYYCRGKRKVVGPRYDFIGYNGHSTVKDSFRREETFFVVFCLDMTDLQQKMVEEG